MRATVSAGLVAAALGAVPALADSYEVAFAKSSRIDNKQQYRIANVEATITPRDGVIGFKRSREDVGLPNGWLTFIYHPKAFDGSGKELQLSYDGDGGWKLGGWKRGPVKVTYTMLLQHDRFPNDPGDDEIAYARDYGVMWTGRALFVEGAPSTNITVEFAAPDDWKITAPWARKSDDGRVFAPEDTVALLDSAFAAGTHQETIVDVAGTEARIATGPEMLAATALFEETLETFMSAYRDLLGADIERSPVVIAARGEFWGGGVMGRSISMIMGGELTDELKPQGRYIVAHEAFHLWNAQWRYDDDKRAEIEWIAEGFAEYYTTLTGVRTGVYGGDYLRSEIARRIGEYRAALAEDSIAGAGRSKLQSEASYNLVYSGGFVATMALDLLIRRETGGAKSFDDVVRAIHAASAGPDGAPLSEPEIIAIIANATGVDTQAFFSNYIDGRKPIPLDDLLGDVGMTLKTTKAKDGWEATLTDASSLTPEATNARRVWAGEAAL